MPTASREAMQATDEPVELIRQELVETDRMCRYYGYLAQRLVRLGELLQFGLVAAPLAAIAALLSAPPARVPVSAAAATALAALVGTVRRYPHKAAHSAETWLQLGRVQLEWEHLWNGIRAKHDAELMSAWKALRERREAIVDLARGELPLSRMLARRSRREAVECWRRGSGATREPRPAAPEGSRAPAPD